VVGYLSPGSQESDVLRLTPFRKGLSETGYIEGRDVAIEYRWADDLSERLPTLAAELVRRRGSVIFAARTPPPLSPTRATPPPPSHSSKGTSRHDPNHLWDGGRPGLGWTCRQPEPTGRQYHRRGFFGRGARTEATGAAA